MKKHPCESHGHGVCPFWDYCKFRIGGEPRCDSNKPQDAHVVDWRKRMDSGEVKETHAENL